MDVRFLRGLAANYAAIATKDNKTFYYVTDEKKLYLGDVLLSNEVTLTAFNALEVRVKALEDAGFQAQIDAINEWKNALPEYVTKAVYDEHITAQDARDDGQDELIAGLRADLDEITEVGGEPNKVNDVKVDGVSVVTDKIANIDLSGKENVGVAAGLVEAAKTELNGEIAKKVAKTDYDAAMALKADKSELFTKAAADELYDVKGAAATAEQNAKNYSDGKLNAVVEQYLTGEGAADTIDTLNEIAQWINNDEAGVAKIIEDVATNTAGVKQNKEDLDKVEAKLSGIVDGEGTVKAAIDAALAEAKKYADDNDANTVYDDTALAGRVSTLEGKVDVDKVSEAIATATTDMATNASVDAKLAAYAKTADISADIAKGVEAHGWGNHAEAGYLKTHQDISHLATKQEVTDGLALKADKATYEAYVEAHKDDYNNAKVDELVAGATDKAQTAQNEVDALEKVVASNAETCTNNFNTISNQLTWGSF